MGEAKELTKKKAFKMPHTLVIIFMIIFAAVLFTWVVPSGAMCVLRTQSPDGI